MGKKEDVPFAGTGDSTNGVNKASIGANTRLANACVAVVGLGLMGGSLALALRGHCAELLGIDTDPEVLALARRKNVVDRVAAHPAELLPRADVVILAAPVRANLTLLGELPGWHPGSPVVLDLSSTKVDVVRAMGALPERFDPIGGHPMCGKERSSLVEAEARLYRDAPFAFTPLPRTTGRARALAEQLALAVGAHPLWIDAEIHDRWVAATSHLPYLLANALAAVTPAEAASLVGPGFLSTTRLAETPLSVMLDVLETNRLNVLGALRRFRAQLDLLESQLDSGTAEQEAKLAETLTHGAVNRRKLVGTSPAGGTQ